MPFVVRWPGKVKPGSKCDETICHTNLMATCAELLGAKLPAEAAEDSFSILPLLRGKRQDEPVFPAVVHQGADGTLAIRRGKWKLVLGAITGESAHASDQLYDLAADLGETSDVAADHAGEVTALRELLVAHIEQGRSTPGPAQTNNVRVPLRLPRPAAKAKSKK